MVMRPVIFVSAVSEELKIARRLVANTLRFLGYEPVRQDLVNGGDTRSRGRAPAPCRRGHHFHRRGPDALRQIDIRMITHPIKVL
jgi:hypothetical protein